MEEIWTRKLRGDLVAGGRNGKHGSYRDERESLFMMENDTKKNQGNPAHRWLNSVGSQCVRSVRSVRSVGSQCQIIWLSEKVKQCYLYRVEK